MNRCPWLIKRNGFRINVFVKIPLAGFFLAFNVKANLTAINNQRTAPGDGIVQSSVFQRRFDCQLVVRRRNNVRSAKRGRGSEEQYCYEYINAVHDKAVGSA